MRPCVARDLVTFPPSDDGYSILPDGSRGPVDRLVTCGRAGTLHSVDGTRNHPSARILCADHAARNPNGFVPCK